MDGARATGRFDWLVELGGASAFASAFAFAALKLAPFYLLPAGVGAFAVAFLVVRAVPAEPRRYSLPEFAIEAIEPIEAAERLDELLLDELYVEQADELLLEDRLVVPDPDSRVVRLFSAEAMPTAGQLKERIDLHLAVSPRPVSQPVPDASQALFAALADLRRSLR